MPRMVSVLQLIAETLDVGKNDGIPWTQFQKADWSAQKFQSIKPAGPPIVTKH